MGIQKTTVELVKEAISIAKDKHGDRLVENEHTIERFLKLAELVDKLTLDQKVLTITTNIAASAETAWFDEESWIEIYVEDLVFRNCKDHVFFKEIYNADKCGFATKNDGVVLYMSVKGMWCYLSE